MSPADRLASLEAGEVLKAGQLFQGLLDEEIEVVVRSKSQAGVVTLDLTYAGVKLATAAGKPVNGAVKWWGE